MSRISALVMALFGDIDDLVMRNLFPELFRQHKEY